MKKLFTLAFLFLLNKSSVFGQLHDNIWLTGILTPSNSNTNLNFTNSRIDFLNEPPIVFKEPIRLLSFLQCGTSISNEEGDLLFYTNCNLIANKENELMENGDSMFLSYNSSASLIAGSRNVQGAIVLPAPSYPNLYYFFNINTIPPPLAPL